MALTKNDMELLSQLLDQKLDQKLEQKFQPLYSGLTGLDKKVECLDKKVEHLDKRVECLEKKVDSLDFRVKKLELSLENDIKPDIKKLAENYFPAAERYEKSGETMAQMQDDIEVLNKVVRHHSSDIAILKRNCNIPCPV